MTAGHMARVAIDFETAGYYGHSACAIGLARIENHRIVDQFYSLVRPPSSRIYFTNIHGLTWRELKTAPPFAVVWPKAAKILEGAEFLLAHNAAFDRRVLEACCAAFGIEAPKQPFLCTLKGSRQASLDLPSRKLSMVCEYFGIELAHHHAESDARGCALVYSQLRKLGISDQTMLL